jgi:protocatechuate 3,4-dioxygenase beta subunit
MGADNRYWMVRSITGAGQDLTGGALTLADADVTDLVVTLTNERTRISGTVVDADGRPVPRATVLLFPADHAGWVASGGSPRTMRRVRADESGRYMADGVPAGDYLLAAYPDGQPDEWPDPRVMAAAAAVATPLTIANGETRTVDLSVPR